MCCWFVCLLVALVNCVFLHIAFVDRLAKTNTLSLHVIVVLGRLVDHLNEDIEDKEKGMSLSSEDHQEITSLIGNHLKWTVPDHP